MISIRHALRIRTFKWVSLHTFLVACQQKIPLILIIAFPVWITREYWLSFWNARLPRAWDGTGHYAVLKIFSDQIFPDTFGWTNAYFAGMPFPNFYPPLFYWLVAAFSKTGLFSVLAVFKVAVAAPLIALPAGVWLLASQMQKRDFLAQLISAFLCAVLLVDHRFIPTAPLGLDYFSTFVIGLYTQPLGFVLLLFWLWSYIKARRFDGSFILSTLLLALVILANFFAAIAACIFITVFVLKKTKKIFQVKIVSQKQLFQKELAVKCAIPLFAVCLTAFWLAPVFLEGAYFVTRPSVVELFELVPNPMWVYYLFSAFGFIIWAIKPEENKTVYFYVCLLLAVIIFLLPSVLPFWFPFQSNRFLSTFNFLLCIPAGRSIASIIRFFPSILKFKLSAKYYIRHHFYIEIVVVAVLLIAGAFLITGQKYDLAFYSNAEDERVNSILEFANNRRDGRYLVEVPDPKFPAAEFDSRAISSYLGAQGNEAATVVFREASPQAIFLNPLVNSFSASHDNYGFSSVLSDDLDFAVQSLSANLERAKFMGVKYLVILTPWIKNKLDGKGQIANRYDFPGGWSIFELKESGTVGADKLTYQPALVISLVSYKGRYNNELSFVRLTEEQFSSAWFDVLLTLSPRRKVDELEELDNFGALIIEHYDYDDIEKALKLLKNYSQSRPLILFSDGDELFRRIEKEKDKFPKLHVIERPFEEKVFKINSERPSNRYDSSKIRGAWQQIQQILDSSKLPTLNVDSVTTEQTQNAITLNINNRPINKTPVLIKTSYHPNWKRSDGEPIYAVSPFYMLTFVNEKAVLNYSRSNAEICAVYISLISLSLLLLIFLLVKYKV